MKKLIILMTFVFQISSCGTTKQEKNNMVINEAKANMSACLKSPDNRGEKAKCAETFYRALSGLSDDDYGKLPALRMATSLYALFIKVDRKEISKPDFKVQIMQISNDFQSDLQNAETRSNMENRAAALEQQRTFINIQRMLSTPSSTINCFRAPGSPVVTCN